MKQSSQLQNGLLKMTKEQYMLHTTLLHDSLNKAKMFMVDLLTSLEEKKEEMKQNLDKQKMELGQAGQ